MAIDDVHILEGSIFQIIRKHFRNEPFYVGLINPIHEVRQSLLLLRLEINSQ